MDPNKPPFTGEYPTVQETQQALIDNGLSDEASTIVTVPMDGSTGPLAQKLTECKSAHLSQDYPRLFNTVVKQMIKSARE